MMMRLNYGLDLIKMKGVRQMNMRELNNEINRLNIELNNCENFGSVEALTISIKLRKLELEYDERLLKKESRRVIFKHTITQEKL